MAGNLRGLWLVQKMRPLSPISPGQKRLKLWFKRKSALAIQG
jgi:hypothetical protein